MSISTVSKLWRPLDADVIANPYPFYKHLQSENPVFQSQTGEWIITRYNDIKNILGDKNRFKVGNRLQWMEHAAIYAKEKGLDYSNIPKALQSFILFQNPPEHTENRKWVHKHWNNEVSNKDLIHKLLVDRKDPFDFVEEVAKLLPLFSISKILGIPEKDALELKKWSFEVIRVMDLYLTMKDLSLINKSASMLLEYFYSVVKDPSPIDQNGIIWKLIADDSHSFNEEELASTFIFLFIAGQETTSAFLSTMMVHIARENLLSEIRSGAIINKMVEELMRFDPPVQLLGRIAQEDVTIRGFKIPAGSTLTLCVGAANRDPEIFAKPDRFDFNRVENQHLAFGFGIHRCLGETMAIQIALDLLTYLIQNVKNIRLANEELAWDRHVSVRRLKSLNLNIDGIR